MTRVSVDTEAIRAESRKWATLADDMSVARTGVLGTWLGPSAFFIGNLTELIHHPAYQSFLDRIAGRLHGAEVEFELISLVLRRMADAYDEGEALNTRTLDDLYRVTPEDVDNVTGQVPSPRAGATQSDQLAGKGSARGDG